MGEGVDMTSSKMSSDFNENGMSINSDMENSKIASSTRETGGGIGLAGDAIQSAWKIGTN